MSSEMVGSERRRSAITDDVALETVGGYGSIEDEDEDEEGFRQCSLRNKGCRALQISVKAQGEKV